MGYNLYIGEAEPYIVWEERYARMGVALVIDEADAPLNSTCDTSNKCTPGYGTWHNFAKEAGLYSAFYAPKCPDCNPLRGQACSTCNGSSVWWVPEGRGEGEGMEGLIHTRGAGAQPLTEDHLKAFTTARERWLLKPESERLDDEGLDWGGRRLDWLVWWTQWALENCTHPTFANS